MNGEEDELGMLDLLLSSHQDLLHTTPACSKFAPRTSFTSEPTLEEQQVLHTYGFNPPFTGKQIKLVRWIPPNDNFCLNVDGASKGNPGICGGGGCIRNNAGDVTSFTSEPTLEEQQVLHTYGFNPLFTGKQIKLVRWIPPDDNFCLNVDGASKGNPGICGGGGCIRNNAGDVIYACLSPILTLLVPAK
ncbi:hypothetical protein Taro_015455 [Colocasia esculenta]|uniref:Uncharacterized protein n=1 Tax=Colocasia esculenta TaxID=4460 RepID=A0A843UPY1_COLES|nr:hypothetical protein [Colocasia esculenta]